MRRTVADLIIRPVLTERSVALQERENKYTFAVPVTVNKVQIRQAIEQNYQVHVQNVNVVTVRGKKRLFRRGQIGYTPTWKKAVVKLRQGEKIKVT